MLLPISEKANNG